MARMEMAKVSRNGEITIPPAICRILNIKEGDKLMFRKIDGKIIIDNSTPTERALSDMQDAMKGLAEAEGVISEEDVQKLVDEARYGKPVAKD